MICCVHCANSPCLPGWLPVCLALCPSPLSLPPSVLHAVVVVVGLFSCFFFLVYFLPTFLAVCSCCLSSPIAAFVCFTNKSTQHIMVLAITIVQVYTCVDWYTCSYMYNICTFSLFPFIICLFSFLYLSLLINYTVPLNSLSPPPLALLPNLTRAQLLSPFEIITCVRDDDVFFWYLNWMPHIL